jgi:hypothetical protein
MSNFDIFLSNINREYQYIKISQKCDAKNKNRKLLNRFTYGMRVQLTFIHEIDAKLGKHTKNQQIQHLSTLTN